MSAVTNEMIDAAMPWLRNIQYMRAGDKRSAVEEAIRSAITASGNGPERSAECPKDSPLNVIEWIRNHYQDYPTIDSLCMALAAVGAGAAESPEPAYTLSDFCRDADRSGLTAETFAAALAKRPEFADCLPTVDVAPLIREAISWGADNSFSDENWDSKAKEFASRIAAPLGTPAVDAAPPDMRAICEALGFDPTNHHNAAKCPYCRPPEAATPLVPSGPSASGECPASADEGSAQEPVEMRADFTDTARAALLWVLWHHQGGSSTRGQPIRFALGMGQHERLNEWQIAEAKRWAALPAAPKGPQP